jgi:hypothetical protein
MRFGSAEVKKPVSKPISLLRFFDDPQLFGPSFAHGDWTAWKAFIAALFAESSPDEATLAIYRAHTGRTTWPTAPFSEATLIVGRRGGKSRILATIAVYLAVTRNYVPYLAPGELATVAVMAAGVDQARAIFRFVLGLIRAVPLLRKMLLRVTKQRIFLVNRVVIEITPASFRTARGFTFAAVLCDEMAFWRTDEASANPDVEILRAIRPGLATIPGSMVLTASSPYAKRGELYASYRRHYGRDDARILVWKAMSMAMNPSPDLKPIVDEAYETDPEAARAEYGAEFRDDLADYVSREAIDAVTMWGRSELPPEPGVVYGAFHDPSGGVSDAMATGVGHLSRNGVCVLDALIEKRPPFNPDDAVKECVALCRRYGVTTIVGDRYAGEWPRARFAEHGIEFQQSARPKSDIYGDLLPLINAGRVELLNHPRLSAQFCGLERRTHRSGKDSIDHAQGGHDDLANAVAGVLVGLDLDRRQPLIALSDVFAADGRGACSAPPLPRHCEIVFAVVAMEGADVAVAYCGHERFKPPLYVLDVTAQPLWRDFFTDAKARLKELKRACTAPWMQVFTPADLVPLFEGEGLAAQAPPDWFDAERSLAFAAGIVGRGLVKFCAPVADKMATQTIGAALAFKAGDAVEMALRTAFIQAIGLKYDQRLLSRPRPAGA